MTTFDKKHPIIRNENGCLIDKIFLGMIIAVFLFAAMAAAIVAPLI